MKFKLSVSQFNRPIALANLKTSVLLALKNSYVFKASCVTLVIAVVTASFGLLAVDTFKIISTGKSLTYIPVTLLIGIKLVLALLFVLAGYTRARYLADVKTIDDIIMLRLNQRTDSNGD